MHRVPVTCRPYKTGQANQAKFKLKGLVGTACEATASHDQDPIKTKTKTQMAQGLGEQVFNIIIVIIVK